jgi:hypothetical protein
MPRPASAPRVAAGVALCLVIAALPLLSKKVRAREDAIAGMRDEVYDKNAARTARLSTRGAR